MGTLTRCPPEASQKSAPVLQCPGHQPQVGAEVPAVQAAGQGCCNETNCTAPPASCSSAPFAAKGSGSSSPRRPCSPWGAEGTHAVGGLWGCWSFVQTDLSKTAKDPGSVRSGGVSSHWLLAQRSSPKAWERRRPRDDSSKTSRKRVHISTRVMTHPVDFAENLSLWVWVFFFLFCCVFFLLRGRSQHLSPERKKKEQEGWMERRGKAERVETPRYDVCSF